MKKPQFGLNIFHKLLLVLLLVTLIPLISLWYINGKDARHDMDAHIAATMIATANTIETGIVGWDNSNIRALRQISRIDDMTSMQAEKQNPILKALTETYEYSFLSLTIGLNGENIGRSDGKPTTYYGERGYVQAILKGAPISREVLLSKTTGKPSYVLAEPIRKSHGEVVGVIAMVMNLTDISKTVVDTKLGETGYAILLDPSNKVIAHGRAEKVKTALQDFSNHPALGLDIASDRPVQYKESDKNILTFKRKLPQGWTLIVEQDYNEAYASIKQMEADARNLILVTIALVFGIAFLISKQLTRPINELTAIATELSSGKFDLAIPQTERSDEIGALALAIQRMGISVQMAMDRLRKKSAE
jgi:methyl-accepting chemotaxis protein